MLSGVWLDRQGSRLKVDKFISVVVHCHNGTGLVFFLCLHSAKYIKHMFTR